MARVFERPGQGWIQQIVASLVIVCLMTAAVEAKSKGPAKPKSPQAKVEGTITAIDTESGKVTITRRRGTEVTVVVDDKTKIEVDDAHAALADLAVGMRGEAKYDPTTFVASKLEGETAAAPQ